MKMFRPPPRKQQGKFKLTDAQARVRLKSIRPITCNADGTLSYPWQFVRETRTRCGTLAFVWRDPFNAANERVWAVDFKTGICRDIGPAQPAEPPPVKLLPPPTPKLLPPPTSHTAERRLAEKIGSAFLRGLRGRLH